MCCTNCLWNTDGTCNVRHAPLDIDELLGHVPCPVDAHVTDDERMDDEYRDWTDNMAEAA